MLYTLCYEKTPVDEIFKQFSQIYSDWGKKLLNRTFIEYMGDMMSIADDDNDGVGIIDVYAHNYSYSPDEGESVEWKFDINKYKTPLKLKKNFYVLVEFDGSVYVLELGKTPKLKYVHSNNNLKLNKLPFDFTKDSNTYISGQLYKLWKTAKTTTDITSKLDDVLLCDFYVLN